jgi:hypothetical protein
MECASLNLNSSVSTVLSCFGTRESMILSTQSIGSRAYTKMKFPLLS